MTTKGITRTGALVATVALLIAGAASAQDGPTIPTGEVSGGALGALDLWSAPGADTGMPSDLWRGASSELTRSQLGLLGTRPLSPAMQTLAVRALLTGAQAPDGAGHDADLAALRVQALTRLGQADAVADMLARTPGVENSAVLTRARAEAALTRGRVDDACEAADALTSGRDDIWQLKLRAWCHMAAGERAAAQLAYDLWARRGEADAAFSSAFEAAQSGEAADVKAAFGIQPVEAVATPVAVEIDVTQIPALIRAGAAEANRSERLKLQSAAVLAAALREDINPDARAALAAFDIAAPRASFARLGALDAAADGNRPGEVVLYALSIAHQQPQGLGTAERAAIVRALARAGLADEALMVAGEGIAAFLPPPPPPPEPDPVVAENGTATDDATAQ